MIRALFRVAALLLLCGLASTRAASAPAGPVREVPAGSHIDWSFARDGSPVRYRSGEVELTFTASRDPDQPELVRPVLSIAMPRSRAVGPAEVTSVDTSPTIEHRATVGRWGNGHPYVLFQSFSGGAHCCTSIQVIRPVAGALVVTDLGEWDGGYLDELPQDIDGDGELDFVFDDNAFLYAFASYAESAAPPMILNVLGDRRVDVSDRPGFRRLFEEARVRDRATCLDPEGMSPNGACAAYVASAARVGRFDEAWAEMLRAYDRTSNWDLPTGCRVEFAVPCTGPNIIRYHDYPEALRAFLRDENYIER